MSNTKNFCDANSVDTLSNADLLSIALSDAAAGLGPKVKRVDGKLVVPTAAQKRRWESRNAARISE